MAIVDFARYVLSRTQCPVENAGEIEDSLTNPRGNKDASNGHTTLSRALSASSGFHSDESSNGNQNSRQNVRIFNHACTV